MGVPNDALCYAQSKTLQGSVSVAISLTVTAPISVANNPITIYLDDITLSPNVTVTSAAEWQITDGASTVIERGFFPASTQVPVPFVKVYAHARKITVSNSLIVSCQSIGNGGLVDIVVGFHKGGA